MQGVSIIIPCWNAGAHLAEAVGSVAPAAGNIPYEIIVVDDASDDPKTYEVLNSLEQISNVRLLRLDKNHGQSYARNRALEIASYDYILPLDADDVLVPVGSSQKNYIEQAVKLLETSRNTAIVYCETELFGERQGKLLLETYNEKRLLFLNTVPAFGIYRKDEAISAGAYNESLRFCEDWDLWITLINRRFLEGKFAEVKKLHLTGHNYRQHKHEENVSKSQFLPAKQLYCHFISRNPEIYRKHYPSISNFKLPDHLVEQSQNKWRHVFACAANHPLTTCREILHQVGERFQVPSFN